MHALDDDRSLPGVAHPPQVLPRDDRLLEQGAHVAAGHRAHVWQLDVRKHFRCAVGDEVHDPPRARNELTRVRHARPEAPLKQVPDAMSKVALAHACNRRIDGHDQHGIARRFRARDRGFRHCAATRDIELIPERTPGPFADFFESSAGKRGHCLLYTSDAADEL